MTWGSGGVPGLAWAAVGPCLLCVLDGAPRTDHAFYKIHQNHCLTFKLAAAISNRLHTRATFTICIVYCLHATFRMKVLIVTKLGEYMCIRCPWRCFIYVLKGTDPFKQCQCIYLILSIGRNAG